MTIIFAVVGYALYLFCFASSQEQVSRETKPVTIKETVATVRQNKPLLILCVSNLVFLTGVFGRRRPRRTSPSTFWATRAS